MHRPAGSPDSPAFGFMRALIGSNKPVVAAVTGAAIGIGTTMLCTSTWSTRPTRRVWRCRCPT